MNINHFNLCRSCVHDEYCSLTTQKHSVWECSDHSELLADIAQTPTASYLKQEKELKTVMA